MSKYSSDQLQQMATEALKAKLEGDPRYAMLVTTIAVTMFKPTHWVEARIEELSLGINSGKE